MAPRKGKVQKEEQVISLGPQVRKQNISEISEKLSFASKFLLVVVRPLSKMLV